MQSAYPPKKEKKNSLLHLKCEARCKNSGTGFKCPGFLDIQNRNTFSFRTCPSSTHWSTRQSISGNWSLQWPLVQPADVSILFLHSKTEDPEGHGLWKQLEVAGCEVMWVIWVLEGILPSNTQLTFSPCSDKDVRNQERPVREPSLVARHVRHLLFLAVPEPSRLFKGFWMTICIRHKPPSICCKFLMHFSLNKRKV